MNRTRHHSSKSHGSSVRSKGGATGSRHSSRHSAATKKGRESIAGLEESTAHKPKPVQIKTVNFIYSEAVSKAFKRNYNATEFGPPSALPGLVRRDPSFIIPQLPRLYNEFRVITRLLEHNQRYIERLNRELASREEQEDVPETPSSKRPLKLPRIARKNMSPERVGQKHRSRVASLSTPVSSEKGLTSSSQKLPPIA